MTRLLKLFQNTVTVGSADCSIISSVATSIQCTAPDLLVGPHAVVVHVEGKGLSNNDKTVTYEGREWFGFMVFNATFNNISAILRQLVLLVEETGVPGENHRPVRPFTL
jgi:hypothetical protein